MFSTIIVPLDGSHRAATVIRLATTLARRWNSRLVLLHVADPAGIARTALPLRGDKEPCSFVQTQLGTIAKATKNTGVDARILIRQGTPSSEILNATGAMDRALMVLTTHGHTGDAAVPLGHVDRAILTHARLPILFVNTRRDVHAGLPMAIEAVTVILDGSDRDLLAGQMAGGLAETFTVPLELLNVIPDARFASVRSCCPPEEDYSFLLDDELREANQIRAARTRMYLKAIAAESVTEDTDVHIAVKFSMTGNPADTIAAHLRAQSMHLGVIADQDRTGIRRFVRAAALEGVIQGMPCALFIARGYCSDHRARGNPVESVRMHTMMLFAPCLAGLLGRKTARIPSYRAT